ncbi:uncharacterized protein MJAP1_004256 [Malassezia japonica]|uniref:Dihydroorotate dehydrogenase (quinone), mitochondrial n=1 Tax=Malassezia japonica TaxID=223818 RepID=A0AAF0F623_9BASI|nr:uncharacterized protein MJAP1_004256 [Malassezia japonica]WFD41259.1 hypothetical protein MJAP1_004256 [Malassezia japonica]
MRAVFAAPLRRCAAAPIRRAQMSARRGIQMEGRPGPLPSSPPPPPPKVNKATRRAVARSITLVALFGGACFGVYCMDSRAGVHRYVFAPMLQLFTDPESGSKFAVKVLKWGLGPRDCGVDDEVLHTELFGKKISNPIGLAAGFDKQAEAIDGLFDLGFGLVEVGSVTPEPQPGNPLPRMFRLPLDAAVINRMGFNSEGHAAVEQRLNERLQGWVVRVLAAGRALVTDLGMEEVQRDPTQLARAQLFAAYPGADTALLDRFGVPRSLKQDRLLSINLGKNKTSREDSVTDYVEGVQRLGPYADMIVVNVSSPNTPGLRRLQRRSVLEGLLRDVVRARDGVVKAAPEGAALPLLVKVAPDLSETELHDVSDAAENTGIDGIIVSNTTISRPAGLLSHEYVHEAGGLSGPPVKPLALHALSTIHARNRGKIPLIGCGGISCGQDALDFAKAGASAVQLYTALAYQGAGLPRRIKDEVTEILRAEGKTWAQVVGTAVPKGEPETYAPDPIKNVGLFPGAQDAFDRSVVSVRNELEHLRTSLHAPASHHDTEHRRAVPFHVDAQDTEYIDLLDKVHRVLDDTPHFHEDGVHRLGLPQRASSVPEHILATASEQHLTQGEVLHQAVHDATHVDVPGQTKPSGAPATTPSGLRAPKDQKLSSPVLQQANAFRDADKHRVI